MQLISSNVRASENKKLGGSKKTSARKFFRPSSSQNKIQPGASGAAGQMAANVVNHAINLLVSSGVLRHTGRVSETALG